MTHLQRYKHGMSHVELASNIGGRHGQCEGGPLSIRVGGKEATLLPPAAATETSIMVNKQQHVV
jgi:hypothetical protein